MTGEQQTRGFWAGIGLYYTDSADNQLDYVTIEYAGAATCNGADTEYDLCLYPGGVRISVTNTTLQQSAGLGFYAAADATLTAFSSNTVTANEKGPGLMEPDVVGSLEDSSTFSGNDVDSLLVTGGDVVSEQTWSALDVPYLLQGAVTVYAPLTVAAGNTLTFGQDVELWVYEGGALTAVGTVVAPILMTGAQATPGYWGTIGFYTTDSLDNQFDHVTIEYGGANECNGADTESNVCLYPGGGVRFNMTNSTSRYSAACGIYVGDDVTVNELTGATANNTFSDNATDVCLEG
jgi:hypothetical protein